MSRFLYGMHFIGVCHQFTLAFRSVPMIYAFIWNSSMQLFPWMNFFKVCHQFTLSFTRNSLLTTVFRDAFYQYVPLALIYACFPLKCPPYNCAGSFLATGIFPWCSFKNRHLSSVFFENRHLSGVFFGKQEVHKMGGQGSKGTLYYTLYGSPVTEVKIVKEVRRSDCLWRFACGNVFGIYKNLFTIWIGKYRT